MVLLELTVPWEDRIEEANERKRAKYSELTTECRSNGWKARCDLSKSGAEVSQVILSRECSNSLVLEDSINQSINQSLFV